MARRWGKWSHKHSYNANSGVGIKATGKLLHVRVHNKICSACAKNISKDQHHCFKNWDGSSSEMGTDANCGRISCCEEDT